MKKTKTEQSPQSVKIEVGLKFKSKNFSMDAEVLGITPEHNILNVLITPKTGSSWVEDWDLEHTNFGFERGEYYTEEKTPEQVGHTPGEWAFNEEEGTVSKYRIYETTTGKNVGWFDPDEETIESELANASLIAAAPALFQMVKDLKNCVKRLSQDDLTQFDRDKEAQWEGEAHELLLKINPNFYKNANE